MCCRKARPRLTDLPPMDGRQAPSGVAFSVGYLSLGHARDNSRAEGARKPLIYASSDNHSLDYNAPCVRLPFFAASQEHRAQVRSYRRWHRRGSGVAASQTQATQRRAG